MRPFWLIILQQVCTESGSLVIKVIGVSPQNALNSGLGIIVVYPETMIDDQVDQVD